MIKRIMRVACCSLILCCLMCGCDSGKEDVLLIGKEEFPVSGIETEGLETDVQEAFTEICVYVCGAVKNPGVVYLPEMSGSRDICILQASGEEGIFLAEFDLDRMREYRKNEVHGNAYRHPKKYGLLTEERIEEPFIRSDYRA